MGDRDETPLTFIDHPRSQNRGQIRFPSLGQHPRLNLVRTSQAIPNLLAGSIHRKTQMAALIETEHHTSCRTLGRAPI